MQKKLLYEIIFLNVRGISDQGKRRRIFSYLKDQKSKFKKHILILMMKIFGETNGDVKYSLSIWHQAQQRCLSPNPLFGAR